MATFLDVSLIKGFSFVFPFLFVWTVMYAILESRKVLGERRELHAVIAFVTAMIVAMAQPAVEIINTMTPWFIVLLMVFVLMIMFFKFFGIKDEEIASVFKNPDYSWVTVTLVIISLIIFAAAAGKVFEEKWKIYVSGPVENIPSGTETGPGGVGEEAFLKTFFHPKVLGMMFIFIIAALTAHLLAGGMPSGARK